MSEVINSATRAEMRVLLVLASEQALLVSDYWHSLFGWERHSVKEFHHNDFYQLEDIDGVERFHIRGYAQCADMCFDELMDSVFANEPSKRFAMADDSIYTEYPLASYVIVMYKRKAFPPEKQHVLQRFMQIQEDMERCLDEMRDAEGEREQSSKGLRSLFRKTREASQQACQAATARIEEKQREFDMLVRQLHEA